MRSNRCVDGGRLSGRSIRWRISAVIVAAATVVMVAAASAGAASLASWPSASQSILGERTQPLEFTINPQNVSHLKPKWTFTMNGRTGESATPTVADGVVYFPDWNGYLYAVNAQTGRADLAAEDLRLRRAARPGVAQQPADRRQRTDPR